MPFVCSFFPSFLFFALFLFLRFCFHCFCPFVYFPFGASAIGQSRREAVKQAMVIDTTENEITSRSSKAGTLLCARKQQHKKKKRTSFRSNFGKGKTTTIV
jgi:hypothetical protein